MGEQQNNTCNGGEKESALGVRVPGGDGLADIAVIHLAEGLADGHGAFACL